MQALRRPALLRTAALQAFLVGNISRNSFSQIHLLLMSKLNEGVNLIRGETMVSHFAPSTNLEACQACDMLHTAASAGDIERARNSMMDQPAVISVLLEAGARTDTRAEDGSTALHTACQENSPHAVAALLRHGANTDLTTKHGHRPYDRIDDVDEAADIVRMLDARGAGKHPQPGKLLRPEFQDCTYNFRLARLEALALPMSKMHRKARPTPGVPGNAALVGCYSCTATGNQHSLATSTSFGRKRAPTNLSSFVGTTTEPGPVMPTPTRNNCAAICCDVNALAT